MRGMGRVQPDLTPAARRLRGKRRAAWLLAVLLVLCSSPLVAQPDEERPRRERAGASRVAVTDLQSGRAALGASATRRQLRLWKEQQAHGLWTAVMPPERRITRTELRLMVRGDFAAIAAFPPPFVPTSVAVMSGRPSLEATGVGMLLKRSAGGDFLLVCTVILVRPDTVLTAAHCVDDPAEDVRYKVFFPYEGYRQTVGAPRVFCGGDDPPGCNEVMDDLAVLRLERPYLVLKPEQLASAAGAAGSAARIAGYGYCITGPALLQDLEPGHPCENALYGNYGIKREADVVLAACGSCSTTARPGLGSREICFGNQPGEDQPVKALQFDSGGPLLLNTAPAGLPSNEVDAHLALEGIARAQPDCPPDSSAIAGKYVTATHAFYADWLALHAFAAMQGVPVKAFMLRQPLEVVLEQLEPLQHEDYLVRVPPGAEQLIVTLNHEPGDNADPVDFSLVLDTPGGEPPEGGPVQCTRHRNTEVCVWEQPPAGNHPLEVQREDNCGRPLPGVNRNPNVPAADACPRSFQMTALLLGCEEDACLEPRE